DLRRAGPLELEWSLVAAQEEESRQRSVASQPPLEARFAQHSLERELDLGTIDRQLADGSARQRERGSQHRSDPRLAFDTSQVDASLYVGARHVDRALPPTGRVGRRDDRFSGRSGDDQPRAKSNGSKRLHPSTSCNRKWCEVRARLSTGASRATGPL